MSLLRLNPSAQTCHKHPGERVVGVCSACLAQKLSSLIHPIPASGVPNYDTENSDLCPPSISLRLPRSTNSPASQEHLQTIKEEDGSDAEVISNEDLDRKCLEAPNLVEGETDAPCPCDHSAQITLDHSEITSQRKTDTSLSQEAPIVNPLSEFQKESTTCSSVLHVTKPIKYRRSKSLSVLGAKALKHAENASHGENLASFLLLDKSGLRSADANKVTLGTLFRLEDAEKHIDRELSDHELNVEVLPHDTLQDAEKRDQEKAVNETPDDHPQNSRCCVPSTSSLSSSACPSVPAKLNFLLCRRTRDEKRPSSSKAYISMPAQVHESRNKHVCADGCKQVHDDGGFIRATYIASISRDPSTRRCRSRERYVTRSSLSSSEPASPVCLSHLDSVSERKFNIAARALAIEVPSIFQASVGGQEEVVLDFLTKKTSVLNAAQGREEVELPQSQVKRFAPCITTEGVVPTLGRPSHLSPRQQCTDISAYEVECWNSNDHQQLPEIGRVYSEAWGEEAAENNDRGEGRGGIEYMDVGEAGATENWSKGRGETDYKEAGGAGAKEHWGKDQEEIGETALWQMKEEETVDLKLTEHRRTERWETGEDSATERWRAEHSRAGEERLSTEQGEAGDGTEHGQIDYGRSVSCKEGLDHCRQQQQEQPQHAIWERYRNSVKGAGSGKHAGPSGRSVCRWPSSSSRTVRRIAPDHPLLRFYLTPLRSSSGRTRPRPCRPPKQHLWSLVFA